MAIPRREPPDLTQTSVLRQIFHQDFYASVILLMAALAALVLANSPWRDAYHAFWHDKITLAAGRYALTWSLQHWVNDGLMVLFFFAVGLEIKRELLVGELAALRRAILPAAAALGGMLLPAIMYLAVAGGEATRGWGIPMATDIAFAIGVMALLDKRVPAALGVLLVALAIVDDIGAILVIAVFYTGNLTLWALAAALAVAAASFIIGRLGVHHALAYTALGILIWLLFIASGIHATVAGVLMAFTIPAAQYDKSRFRRRMELLLDRFRRAESPDDALLINEHQQEIIRLMARESRYVESPLQRFEHAMHPLAVFVVMPIFALANAGITIEWARAAELLTSPVTMGVFLGLVVGKQLGILSLSFVSVKAGLAELPAHVGWRHVYGIGWLAGMGFTMSLFIAQLAFAGNEELLLQAKLGVFLATILCGVTGYILLRAIPRT